MNMKEQLALFVLFYCSCHCCAVWFVMEQINIDKAL